MDRLQQQMQFILEVDKLKKITRQTFLARREQKKKTMRIIPGILL